MKLHNKVNLFLAGCLLLALFFMASPSWADCDHPRFVEHGCGEPGPPGEDGQDGADGATGPQGEPGEVPTEWLTTTTTSINNNYSIVNKWHQAAKDAVAAQSAMQVYLPQDQKSRVTFGMSHINSTTGIAVGYAYKLDNDRNTALTVAIGTAGDETAIQASAGFEFGGSRHIVIPAVVRVPRAVPSGLVSISEGEYENLLMAQQQTEEFEAQQQQVIDQFAKYDSLLSERDRETEMALEERDLERERALAEIERLRREVEIAKAKELEDAARRAKSRSYKAGISNG